MPEELQSRSRRPSNQDDGQQPIRGADRNQDAVTCGAERAGEIAALPSLDPGVTLLDSEGDRGVPILQSLVLDQLLLNDGPAVWIDARGHATTTALARLAPSWRLLDRIHAARGFTAYQHFAALRELPRSDERSQPRDDCANQHRRDGRDT